jgi:hypothetical protein
MQAWKKWNPSGRKKSARKKPADFDIMSIFRYKAGMKNNPPYHNIKLDEELARSLQNMDVALRDSKDAIRSIAAVGALVSLDGKIQPSDLDIVTSVCHELAAAGMPVHPSPQLHVYNLLPPVSSDFLRAAQDDNPVPADLVVVCYICNVPAEAASFHDLYPEQRQGYKNFSKLFEDYKKFPFDRLVAVSPLQSISDIWSRSAYETGARFVATFGGGHDEVSTKRFKNVAHFLPVIATEEKYRDSFYGHGSGSFGFVVRSDYKGQAAAMANPASLLGQRLVR